MGLSLCLAESESPYEVMCEVFHISILLLWNIVICVQSISFGTYLSNDFVTDETP